MLIRLITPAKRQSRAGNRATATRWAAMLRELGHRVDISVYYGGQTADCMIALHAWRSAASMVSFRERYPHRPLILVLTGTDIYRFIHSHPDTTLHSMDLADRLIGLHNLVHEAIPRRFSNRLSIVQQSALPLPRPRVPAQRHFDVCVIGHLRDEKDSLRTALAARALPPDSRVRVIQLGRAHTEDWARRAREEMAANTRYHWRGEVPGWQVRREFLKTRLMVLSSVMEGGANVISEAVVAGVPVLASNIPGSVGLLGEDYAGYYPVGGTDELTAALRRSETDAGFIAELARQGARLAPQFTPERERAALGRILADFA